MVYHEIERPTAAEQKSSALFRDLTQVVDASTNDGWSWQIDDLLATRGDIASITIVDVANI